MMAKAGELDWTDLMKGKVGEPEDPLSKPLNKAPNKGGENVTEEELKKEADFIVDGWRAPGIKAPSPEEFEGRLKAMFPDLARTNEEWDQIEHDWKNNMNDTFQKLQKSKVQEEPDDLEDWGKSKSFNDALSEEEQLQRNMHAEGHEAGY